MLDKTNPNAATLIFPYLNVMQDNRSEKVEKEVEVKEVQKQTERKVTTDRQHAQESPDFAISLPTSKQRELTPEFKSDARTRHHELRTDRTKDAREVEYKREIRENHIKKWSGNDGTTGTPQQGSDAQIREDIEQIGSAQQAADVQGNQVDEYA